MLGIVLDVIVHKLSMDPLTPIKQTKRSFTLKRQKVIQKKVGKLVKIGLSEKFLTRIE